MKTVLLGFLMPTLLLAQSGSDIQGLVNSGVCRLVVSDVLTSTTTSTTLKGTPLTGSDISTTTTSTTLKGTPLTGSDSSLISTTTTTTTDTNIISPTLITTSSTTTSATVIISPTLPTVTSTSTTTSGGVVISPTLISTTTSSSTTSSDTATSTSSTTSDSSSSTTTASTSSSSTTTSSSSTTTTSGVVSPTLTSSTTSTTAAPTTTTTSTAVMTTTTTSTTTAATGACATVTGTYVLQASNTGDFTIDGNFAQLQSAFGSGYTTEFNVNRASAQQFKIQPDCSLTTSNGNLLAMIGSTAPLHTVYFFPSVQAASALVNVNWEALVCNMNADNTLTCTGMGQSIFQFQQGDPRLLLGDQNYGETGTVNMLLVPASIFRE